MSPFLFILSCVLLSNVIVDKVSMDSVKMSVNNLRNMEKIVEQRSLRKIVKTFPIGSIDHRQADLTDHSGIKHTTSDNGIEFVHPMIVKNKPKKIVVPNKSPLNLAPKKLSNCSLRMKRSEKNVSLRNSTKKKNNRRKRILKKKSKHRTQNSNYFDQMNATESPWPIIPGPIVCFFDFLAPPSFVAKLDEFNYVVSIQHRRNFYESEEHLCTGVIYNRRFVLVAPHCLSDSYDLIVTSTDNLCKIDEIIDVDYVIEHEYYNAESRLNDIALIKLKSEIRKEAAKFPSEEVKGRYFYTVGFGELIWEMYPEMVPKVLQKVPVQRCFMSKEENPETLHVETSHIDFTGTLRGDFGGVLTNTRGEVIGLKSKFVKRSTKYEVYTKVQAYMPWIMEMVALHETW